MKHIAIATVAMAAGLAHADELIWSTLDKSDFYSIGPSCWKEGDVINSEMADDFYHEGQVTRVYWQGYGGGIPTQGAWLRFYEQLPDG